LLGSSQTCPVHLIRVKENIYGSQFHPELDKEGIALRIRFYKHKGYFPPEEAESLIAAANREDITEPAKILRRFVEHYSQPA
jgi:GMP synthase (glutamine-hydrolysing)